MTIEYYVRCYIGVTNMTNVTNTVYGIVRSHSGIKCASVAEIAQLKHNTVSGTLTALKYRGMVFNEDLKWYAINSVYMIKHKLNDIHISSDEPLDKWAEGYISALVDYNIINEDEFDELIEYIKAI